MKAVHLVTILSALGDAGNHIERASLLINNHITWIDDDVTLIVYNRVKFLGSQSQQVTNLVGQRAEIPDVCYRHNKLDVTAALTAHLLLGDLNTTPIAHDVAIANALVLTAMALIVLYRTKDALAEETVALRLIGTVVDSLGLEHLSLRVTQNVVG